MTTRDIILDLLEKDPTIAWKKVRLVFFIQRHHNIPVAEGYDALHSLIADGTVHENGYAWLHPLNWSPGDSRHPSPAPS